MGLFMGEEFEYVTLEICWASRPLWYIAKKIFKKPRSVPNFKYARDV
jgi:hypothetical protein